MITKEKLQIHLDNFPEEFSIDELVERLIFIEKLENRIAESEKGETVSEAELKAEMKEWFK